MGLFNRKKNKKQQKVNDNIVGPEKIDNGNEKSSLSDNTAVNIVEEKEKKKKRKFKLNKYIKFNDYEHLRELKPREKYVFHSDYFEIDDGVATILSFFHRDGAKDDFPPFWGINRIPANLDSDVTVILLEQVKRMSEDWLYNHQETAEKVIASNAFEQGKSGTLGEKSASDVRSRDLQVIAEELVNGSAYLNVHNRLFVKAPNIESLDRAVDNISNLYTERFATLDVDAYPGSQREEYTNLFRFNSVKRGKGFYFTSDEYAGSYHLVTQGIADDTGEYIGDMLGDVNTSAIIFDVNKYKHHVVVASNSINEDLGRSYVSDMWGSKISQEALKNNARVVHIILNRADLNKLGPELKQSTAYIDMGNGDVNMFEVFGDVEDELSLFAQQQTKLVLMAQQIAPPEADTRVAIETELKSLIRRFYVDMGMWRENAKKRKNDLRLVGIPHDEVPRLEDFALYLAQAYDEMNHAKVKDAIRTHAVYTLNGVFSDMLDANGDLFNTYTSDKIDKAKTGNRVIYDFSGLARRSTGIAMAQLVNVISFAASNLSKGDTFIIHGAEKIDKGVIDYMLTQIDFLYEMGGRVVFLYNNIDKMLDSADFNDFDTADYTVLGGMSEVLVDKYQEKLNKNIPPDLRNSIVTKRADTNYIRRGFDNVVFSLDLSLGISSDYRKNESINKRRRKRVKRSAKGK